MAAYESTGLDAFFGVLSEVRKVALVAAGGLLFLPLIVSLSGYSPPCPVGVSGSAAIVGMTSLTELVVLIVCFQLMSHASRALTSKLVIFAALFVIGFSIVYLFLNVVFVYRIPNNPTSVVMGCGLSENARRILLAYGQNPVDVCPGEFQTLLSAAQYETDRIWTKVSVSIVKALLVLSWLAAFGALAVLTGVFVSFQRRQHLKTPTLN